jgi:demethylmenaquinone methyltransferase/2-methoxy-6-polyprenyl-1,4-benzoquinol methylase
MATGTGDLAFNLCKIPHVSHIYGIDLSQEMLNIAQKKIRIHQNPHHLKLKFVLGDAMNFSWPTPVDAITMSFGIRNVSDAKRTLINFKEKLKLGGRLYILEFAYPEQKFLRALYLFYFRSILPRLGRLISQDSDAYQYLFESVKEFPKGQEFASLMEQAGLNCLMIKKLSFGIVHLYIGEKAVL